MEKKRSKKNLQNSRIARLKKRRRKTRRIILLATITLILILSGFIINKVYISSKCSDLQYAVDYYFTNWKDENLRLSSVKTMGLINKVDNTATVEAFGLSYEEPKQRTTLIGTFKKNEKGRWVLTTVENKNNSLAKE